MCLCVCTVCDVTCAIAGRQDYYRFLLRSLLIQLRKSSDRSVSKEAVGGGKGKVGLFEVLHFRPRAGFGVVWYCCSKCTVAVGALRRYTFLKELLALAAKSDMNATERLRAKLLDPESHQTAYNSSMVWASCHGHAERTVVVRILQL